jgi:hypothetical protein
MMFRSIIILSLGAAALSLGCSSGDLEDEDVATSQDAIWNGTIVTPFVPGTSPEETQAIVGLPGCTGTIVDPEWVSSATHCGIQVGAVVTSVRPNGNVTRTVDRIVPHPSIDAVMLHVSSPFTDIPRIPLYPNSTADIIGQTVAAYGYGQKAAGNNCSTNADCPSGQWCGGYSCFTPSTELRTANLPTAVADDPGYFMTLKNSLSQMALPGDSGGPCFLSGALAGIHSSYYLDLRGGSQVSVPEVRDWMLATMMKSMKLWNTTFGDANGWHTGPQYYGTLAYPDVNGDGKADACGRSAAGVSCAVSNGAAFVTYSLWGASFSDANGWNIGPQYYETLAYPDVNGDGKADVCGRGGAGVYCAISNGTSFVGSALWSSSFSDANGWNIGPEYYSTIAFPDVNDDGKADVCGRGGGGVYCAISNGTSFVGNALWGSSFSDANGWNLGPEYYSTLTFPDVNGDGKADVCGRGGAGVRCAVSNGTSFVGNALWDSSFGDANGWNSGQQYYSTVTFPDVNGDQKADVCGRGGAGIWCAISSGAGFGASQLWSSVFKDSDGGNQPQYYRTIMFPDVDHDGRADMCGRTIKGTFCAFSKNNAFVNGRLWSDNQSDANGWNQAPYYSTIRFADVDNDGRPELCARGGAGIHCEL